MKYIYLIMTLLLSQAAVISQQFIADYEALVPDIFKEYQMPISIAFLKFNGNDTLEPQIHQAFRKETDFYEKFTPFSHSVIKSIAKNLNQQIYYGQKLNWNFVKLLRNDMDIKFLIEGEQKEDAFVLSFINTERRDTSFYEYHQSNNSTVLNDIVKMFSQSKKAVYSSYPFIYFDIYPADAELNLNSQDYYLSRQISLPPGEYNLEISRRWYKSAKTKINVDGINERTETISLEPLLTRNLVFVQGGEFEMGNNKDQGPAHKVKVSDFYISNSECTVKEYREFCNLTNRNMPPEPEWGWSDEHPIVNVSWNDANDFCIWRGARLPTEAEWEYAARGGKQSKGHIYYSGSDNTDSSGWNSLNSGKTVHNVKSKIPNELGLFDMSGNVFEWCSDWWDSNYYRISAYEDPKGPESGNYKILRGGSFICTRLDYLKPTTRTADIPSTYYPYYGFRYIIEIKKHSEGISGIQKK